MNPESSVRTAKLLGAAALAKIEASRVIVFGLGGVGSFAAEALARGGVGNLALLDFDNVEQSNVNRQLLAMTSTIGQQKTDVMMKRVLDINPAAHVEVFQMRYTPENAEEVDLSRYDYIVDAIDSLRSKVELIVRAKAAGTPIISATGTGNKLDPTRFVVTDLFATENCPLARLLRKRLRKRGVDSLDVVFSSEEPSCLDEEANDGEEDDKGHDRAKPGTVPFVPPVAGFIMAGVVLRRLAGLDK